MMVLPPAPPSTDSSRGTSSSTASAEDRRLTVVTSACFTLGGGYNVVSWDNQRDGIDDTDDDWMLGTGKKEVPELQRKIQHWIEHRAQREFVRFFFQIP